MPNGLTLDRSDEERDELKDARDHHEKPYIRERARALPKIADGQSGRTVALEGLLRKRKPDTVYDWYHRYKEEDFDELFTKEVRGRKPAFSPNMTRQKT